MTGAPFTHGHLVGGRYRLEAELGRGTACRTWRAVDERLERRVAVRIFDRDLTPSLLEERAALAASLTHPRVVRIFDTGYDNGWFFTVSELLAGTLAWSRSPLPPHEALELALEAVDALQYAHERGVAHGHLHPGNILLGEQGIKVADFALSRPALDGAVSPADDLRALGALLHRVLTGRGPREPIVEGKPLADDPPGISGVIGGLLDGHFRRTREVAVALERLRVPPEDPSPRPRTRRWPAVALVPLLALLVFAAVQIGDRGPSPTPAPTPGERVTGSPVSIATVQDLDPFGDEQEHRDTVANVADDDPQTFWTTERYHGDPHFGGLKEGVGIIVDLGEEREIAGVQVLFTTPGCSYEIRYSPVRSHNVGDWTTVASAEEASTSSGTPFDPEASRWWLLWLTELTQGVPDARDGYACGVAELELFAP